VFEERDRPPSRGGQQAIYSTDEWPVVVGLGHDLTSGKLVVQLPQFAENNDWRVVAAGLVAKVLGQRATSGGVAVGVEHDQVGPEVVRQRDGLRWILGFDRIGAAELKQ